MKLRIYGTLLPHQIECVEKFDKLKVGANFMDMGTGKTITMLELIRRKSKKIDKVMWFTPVSTIENLKRNIEKLSNFLDYDLIKIIGIESLSQSDRVYLESLRLLEDYKDVMLIIDESMLVKNFFAKRTNRMIYLSSNCKYRFILNGTPVTRSIVDIFSQFYLLDKRIIGYSSFFSFANNHFIKDDYGKVVNVLDQEYLMQRITPYTYKVKKEDCLDLPNRIFDVRYYNMTEAQEEHYEEVKYMFLSTVDDFDETTIYRLFTALQLVTSGRKVWEEVTGIQSKKLKSKNFFDKDVDNPRIRTLLDIVEQEEDKTIVWCKYKHEIDSICKVLSNKFGKDNVCRFDGQVSLKDRDANIKKFEGDARFLVANKACGRFGMNLQFCNRLIYYNNDFDWGTRSQSLDRVYRYGQANKVYVTDICASYKIDERIMENLKHKTNLDETFNMNLKKFNKTDIDKWLDNKLDVGKGRRNAKNRIEQIREGTRDSEAN